MPLHVLHGVTAEGVPPHTLKSVTQPYWFHQLEPGTFWATCGCQIMLTGAKIGQLSTNNIGIFFLIQQMLCIHPSNSGQKGYVGMRTVFADVVPPPCSWQALTFHRKLLGTATPCPQLHGLPCFILAALRFFQWQRLKRGHNH